MELKKTSPNFDAILNVLTKIKTLSKKIDYLDQFQKSKKKMLKWHGTSIIRTALPKN